MRRSETISQEYTQLNRELHQASFGGAGHKRVVDVLPILEKHSLKTVLDYGCGQGLLSEGLPTEYQVTNYDPAVEVFVKKPARNKKFDLVVCTDVLEHIEPNYLEAVLEELWTYTGQFCYLLIACNPSGKTLSDGRNAHLIQEQPEWWLQMIMNTHPWVLVGETLFPDKYQEGLIKKIALTLGKP